VVIIKTRILKLSILAVAIGIALPSNLFVYGTADTMYTENVASTLEISNIELNTEIIENKNTTGYVNSEIASVLGLDYNKANSEYIVYAKELTDYGILVQTVDTEAADMFNNLTNVELDAIKDCDLMVLNSIEESSIEADVTQLVALEDLNIYNGPSLECDVIGTLNEEDSIEITSIQKDGFSLLSTETADAWVENEKIGDISEIYKHRQGTALIDIPIPDVNYNGGAIELTPDDRDICERLVMGEAGGQGFEGAALVAQALRDSMLYKGFDSVNAVRVSMGYSGSIYKTPNQDTLDAVAFIFDEGGYVVRHPVFYFYNPAVTRSSFHESRIFVIEYKQHRFFG